MAGFFNKMYYGDPNKGDLRKSDVNKEGRMKLFFTTLGVRFWKLIQVNLLYSLCLLPALFIIYINYMPLLLTLEEIPVADITSSFASASMVTMLMLVPCLVIVGPPTAGVMYVLRNWARDDHAWLWSDFKDKALENWKQSALLMLINGLAMLLLVVNVNFYAFQQATFLFSALKIFMLIIGIIYGAMNLVLFPLMVTYDLKIKHIFRNTFIMIMAELPKSIGIFIICAVWIALCIFYSLSFLLPVFIIGFAFPMFVAASFANYLMDKYMKNNTEGEENERIQE
jgi:uncharacterized membrane protein YesL